MTVTKLWWLASFIISLAGFAVVGAISLSNGEALLWTSARAVAVFIALWVVQSFLRGLLGLAVVPELSKKHRASESSESFK